MSVPGCGKLPGKIEGSRPRSHFSLFSVLSSKLTLFSRSIILNDAMNYDDATMLVSNILQCDAITSVIVALM